MPIFARRRLCLMFSELSSHLSSEKPNELLSRLDHSDTKTALAAEAELAVLWAISRVAHLETEPTLPNSTHRPDAASDNLFYSRKAVIEIRALSDDSFSGKEAMDRTANIIAGYADRLRKGAGKHLYFEFNERHYWTNRFHRERCVDPSFNLCPKIAQQIRQWVTAPEWPNPPNIRITHDKTDVIVSWRQFTIPLFRTFCRMPPVAYDLEDNPIYKALKKKARQVKGVDAQTLRCVVLVDAGCDLLRRLRPMGSVREIGGAAIIRYALTKLSIDAVVVLSPWRQREVAFARRSRLLWKVTCFDRRTAIPDREYDRFNALAAQFPAPLLEGYQARDIHRQGLFAPASRRWYLPTCLTTQQGGTMTVKLSAGLLHEYLAGRIDAAEFKRRAFHHDGNVFELGLTRGHALTNVQFESGGVDQDDDYITFDLDFAWEKIASKKKS